jgi:serine/threonine protein kinase
MIFAESIHERSGSATFMSGNRIGKFQVQGTLGTGAHSTILHIRRSADARHYALKVVPIGGAADRKFLEQAQHEFRVGQMLDHPNLIKVHALEQVRDWLFRVHKVHLLIEYVNGKTLDKLRPLAVPQLVQVFACVAGGLAHMHRRNVCHADLKPNNILISKTGDVKIIDYGLAWIKGQSKGRFQGTPEYMAPEQAKRAIVNEQTDMFNFGATMYRLTTFKHPPSAFVTRGDIPLDAQSWALLLKPVQEQNAQAPQKLCDLIHKCLSFNPHQRPERMADVKEALDGLAEELIQSPEDRLEEIEW